MVARTLSRRRKVAFFFDFDGTLAPLVPDPPAARLSLAVSRNLVLLLSLPQARTAIVSGRSLVDLSRRVPLRGLGLAGNHGLEIALPEKTWKHPVVQACARPLARLSLRLRQELHGLPGWYLESKGAGLAIHYRHAPPEAIPELFRRVEAVVGQTQEYSCLRLVKATWTLEIRPAVDWDKGRAVEWILLTWYGADWPLLVLPVFVGDEATDEDAFRFLGSRGITVMVDHQGCDQDRLTAAQFTLAGPEEMPRFLGWWYRECLRS